jgi:hypothetical protein
LFFAVPQRLGFGPLLACLRAAVCLLLCRSVLGAEALPGGGGAGQAAGRILVVFDACSDIHDAVYFLPSLYALCCSVLKS